MRYSYLEKKERNRSALPALVRFASGVTLILFALTLYAGVQNGLAALPQILFLSAVVVRMWCRDPWAGYGAAVVMVAGVVNAVGASFREGHLAKPAAALAVGSVFLAWMYWRVGRTLGSVRPLSRAVPWVTFAVVLILFPIFFSAYYVPSGGMEPTVLQGDSLLIRRRFSGVPGKGEIVVMRYPPDRRQVFIKRVVAVGGDRVRIRDKKLFVNGSEAQEPYAIHNTPQTVALRDNFPELPDFPLTSPEWAKLMDASAGKEITVPDGKMFVLGDNRDASLDSRYWGFIEPSDILGSPLMVYWSLEKRHATGDPDLPLSEVRWNRVFHRL